MLKAEQKFSLASLDRGYSTVLVIASFHVKTFNAFKMARDIKTYKKISVPFYFVENKNEAIQKKAAKFKFCRSEGRYLSY